MSRTGQGGCAWATLASVMVLAGVSAMGPPARAGEADDLVKQGVELRRKGRDAQALDLFKRAHEIDHGPRVAAQLGFAEQALGMWADAETHLTAALQHGDDPWIKKNLVSIRKAMDFVASRLGTLDVWGEPAGAEVLVGGTRVGVLPLAAPLRVTAGEVAVTVRAEGYLELVRQLEVGAGSIIRERFELARKAARSVTLAATSDVAGQGAGGERPQAQIQAQATEPTRASSRSVFSRWWFWTLVGAVALGGATTAYVLTRPHNDCPTSLCTPVSP
jgi:PEGA domain